MKTHVNAKSASESINILGILELGEIFWMNLISLAYFLTNKTQYMDLKDLNALLSQKIETLFFAMTTYLEAFLMVFNS